MELRARTYLGTVKRLSVMHKPTVLVTGLSGLIGTRFLELYGNDFNLINVDLTTGVDITNRDQIAACFASAKANSVIHMAAYTNVKAAFEQTGDRQGLCYQVNVEGTRNVVQAAQEYGTYLIHVSTDFVFDGTKEEAYTEEDEPHPIEWYSQTKYEAETIVRDQAPGSVILRLAYPYQAKPNRPDFLNTMISDLTHNRLPPMFADHYITPTFADDLAKVFAYCINKHPQGIYHAVGSSWHTDYDIAQLTKGVFNLTGKVQKGSLDAYVLKAKRPYQKHLRISNKKLLNDFNLEMLTLPEGLEQVRRQLLA